MQMHKNEYNNKIIIKGIHFYAFALKIFAAILLPLPTHAQDNNTV
jgi:hypothetical protein